MSDEIFEQTGHCRACGKRGSKNELRLNGGLCWACRGDEIREEESFIKAGTTDLETHFNEHKCKKVKG